MPIKLAPTTTIKQIANAAFADSSSRQGDKQQLSLNLDPGSRELSFYPPVHPAAATASGDVREALTAAVRADLCTDEAWARNPGYARVHAEEILQHVFGEGPNANPTLAQLLDLCIKTRGIANYIADPKNSREVVEIWANATARSAASAGSYTSLAALEPWHRGVSLLRDLEAFDKMSRRPEGTGVKLLEDLTAVAKFLGLDKVVFPELTNIKRYGQETERRLAATPALQYAVLEFGEEALNTGQPTFNVNRFARLLPHLSEHAFQPVFIHARGFALLKFEVNKLCSSADGRFAEQMQRKITILGRNVMRFEAFLQSPLSRVPALQDYVSVEFQVGMFERLGNGFNPRLSTDKELIFCDTVRALQASWKSVPDVSLPVRLQSSLAELVDDDGDESRKSQWEAAAADVEAAFSIQLDHIYACESVIEKLHEVLLSKADGKLRQPTLLKLAVLQKNAARMEAFLQSGISRIPQFDNVDRARLIPWWAAVKHLHYVGGLAPDHRRGSIAQTQVVMHTKDVSVEEPVESTLPVEESNPQASVEAPAALPDPAAGPSTGPASVATSACEAQGPPSSQPVNDEVAAPMALEVKQPMDESSRRTAHGNQAAPQVFLRPAQLLPSANPLRTDRPPTGKERARRNSRSDHHDGSKAKWLSAEVRRYRAAQADLAAIAERK